MTRTDMYSVVVLLTCVSSVSVVVPCLHLWVAGSGRQNDKTTGVAQARLHALLREGELTGKQQTHIFATR